MTLPNWQNFALSNKTLPIKKELEKAIRKGRPPINLDKADDDNH
ncbi:hypothetical protein [Mariniflexile fucanivorans]|nr:hypothetical protein [Mariniflexile fucanivorans]